MGTAPKTAEHPPGLTTTKAPFIEEARAHGEIYIIDQPYELYSEENQATWARLLTRMQDRWARYANRRFLEGMAKLQLSADRIPHLDEVNRFLQPLTGFRSSPPSWASSGRWGSWGSSTRRWPPAPRFCTRGGTATAER